jgi:hypothetical protein
MSPKRSTPRHSAGASGPENPAVKQLLAVMDAAYDKKSWHGTNLRGSVRRVSAEAAAWRPAPDRHSIWELVVHAAYWKYIGLRRLTGAKKGSFPLKGSNFFGRGDNLTEKAWREDIALMDRTHAELRGEVEKLADRDLLLVPPGSAVSNFALLSGVAAHDLYHAGQIQLLKRLRVD